MRTHSADFKNEIKKMGRQLYDEITYTKNNQEIVLHNELYRVDPHYKGNLLKSVMKELEIESSVEIEKDTIVNYRMGLLVNGQYEYINYGNYIVYSVEKIEDSDKYKMICYDKMLYFMKNYENMNITYPISLRDYINRLVQFNGLTFANRSSTFANYNRMIQSELYLDSEGNDIGYTFRDVLDEIAQATGSIVCINNNDEVEIRYITNTNDYIDENYLKNVNVKFGEKYGPVNAIVLSRSGESDNVFINNPQSIEENGLTEIKIIDNQLMNWNDRADYLNDLASVLMNLEYYINDFSSTGILYYELGDRYSVYIGENSYSCVMLNDEVERKEGLQELIHTDMLEETETDYTKADKDDRKINRTYLIVDKQNQRIDAVIENVSVQDNKIATISATVDELNTKISDIADVTKSGETSYAVLELTGINESEPIMLKVNPISQNISYLYPRYNLYPSNDLYMTTRVVRFYNTTTDEYIDFEFITDLLYYDSTQYDKFYLDYASETCYIEKSCGYNADGTVHGSAFLPVRIPYDPYPVIHLEDGDYRISLLNYNVGYIMATLMASNIYTTQYATKVEVSTKINQKADEIDLEVNEKLTNYSTTTEMNSAINVKANEITSTVSSTYETKTSATQKYSQLQQTDAQISSTVATKVGNNEVISKINQSAEAVTINANKISLSGKTINLTSDNMAISSTNFNVDTNGNVTARNAQIITNDNASSTTIGSGSITTKDNGGNLGVVINKQYAKFYSYTSSNNLVGVIGSTVGFDGNAQRLGIFCDSGDSLAIGVITGNNSAISRIIINAEGNNELKLYNPEILTEMGGTSGYIGYTMAGVNRDHKYNVHWDGSHLWFFVDGTVVGSVSDRRLKKDIKEIDENLINAISECEILEFIAENSGGKKSFGIMAQDLIENCKKYHIENIFDYNIIQKNKFKIDEDTEYFFVDYNQFLIAKNMYLEKRLNQQQKDIDFLKEEIEKLKGGK